MMDPDIKRAIIDALATPKRVQGDEGEVENRNVSELIRAAEWLAKQDLAEDGFSTTHLMRKIIPGNTLD